MAVTREIIDRGHFGEFTSAAELPNVDGSPNQVDSLRAGDVAIVGGVLYTCATDVKGAAVWGPDAAAAAAGYTLIGERNGAGMQVMNASYVPLADYFTGLIDDFSSWTRIGNGAGVPSAGDHVTWYGSVQLYKNTAGVGPAGVSVHIPAPFQPAQVLSIFVRPLPGDIGDESPLHALGPIEAQFDFGLKITLPEGFPGEVSLYMSFVVHYRTANAVDS